MTDAPTLTPELQAELVSYIADGMTYAQACQLAALDEALFYEWKIAGSRQAKGPLRTFSDAVNAADEQYRAAIEQDAAGRANTTTRSHIRQTDQDGTLRETTRETRPPDWQRKKQLQAELARAAKRDQPKKDKPLTPRQRLFVAEYPVDYNASAAVIRAGYDYEEGSSGARVEGSRLLKKPAVKKALEEAEQRRAERLEITADAVVAEMWRIAKADLRDVISIENGVVHVTDTDQLTAEQSAAIASISETRDGITVKMHSKTTALEQLGKWLGMFSSEVKVEHSGSVEGGSKPFEIVIVDAAGQAVPEDDATDAE